MPEKEKDKDRIKLETITIDINDYKDGQKKFSDLFADVKLDTLRIKMNDIWSILEKGEKEE